MSSKEGKKCVSFWIDEEILNRFDDLYHARGFFIRECIIKAIEDTDFYIDVTCGVKRNGNKKRD